MAAITESGPRPAVELLLACGEIALEQPSQRLPIASRTASFPWRHPGSPCK